MLWFRGEGDIRMRGQSAGLSGSTGASKSAGSDVLRPAHEKAGY